MSADARNALQSLTVKIPKDAGKAHFVGLTSSNDFILYQPQNDTLALHEWIGLNLSRSTGEYASPQQFVEVRTRWVHTFTLRYCRHSCLHCAYTQQYRQQPRLDLPRSKANFSCGALQSPTADIELSTS